MPRNFKRRNSTIFNAVAKAGSASWTGNYSLIWSGLTINYYYSISYFFISSFPISYFLISHSLFYHNPGIWVEIIHWFFHVIQKLREVK